MNTLLEISNRPFPIIELNREKMFVSFFFRVFAFLFLLVFELFGIDKVLYNIVYGLNTTFVILFHNFISMYILKQFFIPDDMELSVKWRYASGKPYTEMIYTTRIQHRVGGVTWTDGSWLASDNINGMRYPNYHRLDFGFNSRFNFDTWNLVINLSFQNIYNRKNIAMYDTILMEQLITFISFLFFQFLDWI